MMNTKDKIAVTSRSFSENIVLRKALLEKYTHVIFNDAGLKLENQTLIDFLKSCNKVIAGLEKFNAETLSQLPNISVISRFGVGLDGIDHDALRQYNVRLVCTPGINRLAVAELTLSFMLSLIRNSFATAYTLKQNQWQKTPGSQLTGKTIGIVGANHIGKEVIRLLSPFQCHILVNDIVDLSDYCQIHATKQVSFDDLIEQADIVSLHVPATTNTKHLINKNVLQKMKRTSFLINTARGSIVDQMALKHALQNKMIAGAALDVFETEPVVDAELLSLPNLICTPHIAGNTKEAELAMGYAAISGLEYDFSIASA